MSSLIVLCPHCLTWIETHAECCTECGCAVNITDADPAADLLVQRLGVRLLDLGPMKLLRRGWPGCGRLLATTEGLLFVPQYLIHPNGALEAATDDVPGGSARVAHLFHWWSLPPWRRPMEASAASPSDVVPLAAQPVLDLLLDSPGGFFIQRSLIQRITFRWGRTQIERPPSRSVTLASLPGGSSPHEALRLLIEFPQWRSLVAGL